MMDNNRYVIGPRALNDYTANLPENDKRKKDKWWEEEKKVAYAMMVSSPMDKKSKSENF